MAYVIANTATKSIIGKVKGDVKFTIVSGERGSRKFSKKEQAEKVMATVVAHFGNFLPWEVIDTNDITSRVQIE